MTLFGDRVFREVIKVKLGHKAGALIQEAWCPFIKRERPELACCHVRRRQSASQDGGLLESRSADSEKQISVPEAVQCVAFCYGSLS